MAPPGILVGGYAPAAAPAGNPPTFVNVAGGDLSPLRAFGNVNNFDFNDPNERRIERETFGGGGTPAAGDICVAMHIAPGYLGQSLINLRQGVSFAAWSNVVGSIFRTASDTGEICGGLWVRECDGTDEDDCRIGSHGNYPSATQIARLTGNPFTFPGTITADNENSELIPDPAGAPSEGDMFGGFNECIEFFVSWKRGTAAQVTDALQHPAGYTPLGAFDSIDNGFDQGMTGVWGYQYSENFADRKPVNQCGGASYSAGAFAVGARYKTDLS